jgi:predicted DNA-binding transcriptional regulator AlpA
MTPTTTERLYGIGDIAAALGMRAQTLAQWHRRGKLPPADATVSGRPVWYAATIEPWINQQKDQP